MPSEYGIDCSAFHLPDDRLDLLGDLALRLLWSGLAAKQVTAVGRLFANTAQTQAVESAIAANCLCQELDRADAIKIYDHRISCQRSV